jgi:hypothetical protein
MVVLSLKLVVTDVPIWLSARNTRYPVTPTLSVLAVQTKFTFAGEVAVAIKPVGAVGGAVSGAPEGKISIIDMFHMSVVGAVSLIVTEDGAVAVPGAAWRCVQNVSPALARNSSTLV